MASSRAVGEDSDRHVPRWISTSPAPCARRSSTSIREVADRLCRCATRTGGPMPLERRQRCNVLGERFHLEHKSVSESWIPDGRFIPAGVSAAGSGVSLWVSSGASVRAASAAARLPYCAMSAGLVQAVPLRLRAAGAGGSTTGGAAVQWRQGRVVGASPDGSPVRRRRCPSSDDSGRPSGRNDVRRADALRSASVAGSGLMFKLARFRFR